MSKISIPDLTPVQADAYKGGGHRAIVETSLTRRFAIYACKDGEWVRTDKCRQIRYKLVEGQATRNSFWVK